MTVHSFDPVFAGLFLPVAIFLDQPEERIKAQTGGRGSYWLKEQGPKGLPIHRRGEGKAARYFVDPIELRQYLHDTSVIDD